jgi:FkbM family methyltransferase
LTVAGLLRSSERAAERAARLVQRWRSGQNPVYVMGRNSFTSLVRDFALRNQLTIAGIISNDLKDAHWHGIARCELDQAPVDATVINCVPDGRTLTLQKQIRRANLVPLTYFELRAWSASDFPLSFLTPPFTDADEGPLAWVREQLEDEYSRETFSRVLEFRSSLDVEPLAPFPFDIQNQYVESFLRPLQYLHLVDGGVYDGRNTRVLLDAYPSVRRATLLEPNLAMHATIRDALAGHEFELLGKGLWHSPGQLRFNSDSGPASGIDENGSEVIDVTRIDDLSLPERTLIKLDLEGAELAALQGAARTIVEKRPGLAIATYHDNRHFYQIPQLVLGLRSDYRMRVRHYTEGRLETIYYFL